MNATPDSTFTNPEQLIADLQRQLVECKAERDEAQRKLNETTTERDEALARGAATAEVLRVINSSPGELAPVFEAVLQSAVRICEANFGTLYLRETDAFRAVAMHNAPPAYAEARTRALLQPPPDAPLGRVAVTKQVAHIADIRTNRSYVERHPFVIDAAELGNFRTVLSVPMLRDDELIGAININRQEVRPFTDKQIELVRTFADQAVIAIENGRLLTETREALEQQTATAEVLQVINSSPGDLAPVFEAMLEKAARLCEAPFGNLRTWDGERFHFGAVYGDPQFSDWVRERGPVRPDRDDDSPLGQIIKGERIVRFTVAPGDEGYWTSAGFMEMVAVSGMRSGITVALTKDETLLGTISVYRQELRPFSDKQISLLQNFATQAVIAMENARLLGELRTRTNDLEESLEYQTAMGDVLKIISRTDAKIDAVLDTLVRRASHICEADQAVLHQLRGHHDADRPLAVPDNGRIAPLFPSGIACARTRASTSSASMWTGTRLPRNTGSIFALGGFVAWIGADPANSAFRQTVAALWLIAALMGLIIAAVGVLGATIVHALESDRTQDRQGSRREQIGGDR